METKPLTKAQQNHLQRLVETRAVAQAAVDQFVGYLVTEHDAPESEGWHIQRMDVGFERDAPPKK